jgi:phosphate transport system permease protein
MNNIAPALSRVHTLSRHTRLSLRDRRRRATNGLMWVFCILATLLALIPLGLLLAYVILKGLPALNLAFFTQLPKPAGETGGGLLNAIIGSLVLIGLGSAIGLPIGILGGIYLAEFGNHRFAWSIRFAADVLSGVPSIVLGVFVYAVIVLPIQRFSAFAGGVALAVIMIPTIMRTTEEMIRLVPNSLREAALSLGATQSRTSLGVVLPAARAGVITGALLAVARIAGETAPLIVTVLGSSYLSTRLDQPIAALPLQIYVYATGPYETWHAQAWAGSLVLVVIVVIFSLAARFATRGRMHMVR